MLILIIVIWLIPLLSTRVSSRQVVCLPKPTHNPNQFISNISLLPDDWSTTSLQMVTSVRRERKKERKKGEIENFLLKLLVT
jgi:hypothetical protein